MLQCVFLYLSGFKFRSNNEGAQDGTMSMCGDMVPFLQHSIVWDRDIGVNT